MLPIGNPCTVHTAHRQAAPARAVFLILAHLPWAPPSPRREEKNKNFSADFLAVRKSMVGRFSESSTLLTMGCCASLPSADDFFATAPPPSIAGERPRLIDGLPNTVTVNPSPVVMSSIGSTDNSDGGVGPPFTADICDVGGTQVLARLQLPPHRSFGIGATLFDSAGAPVASLRSAHSTRQHGSSSSSYHVLAKAPLFAGQAPTASGEIAIL